MQDVAEQEISIKRTLEPQKLRRKRRGVPGPVDVDDPQGRIFLAMIDETSTLGDESRRRPLNSRTSSFVSEIETNARNLLMNDRTRSAD